MVVSPSSSEATQIDAAPKAATSGLTAEQRASLNKLSGAVVDAALRVHTELGPGLLESAYEVCLAYELRKRGLKVLQQVALPVVYEGQKLEAGYRIDLLIENVIVVEIKACEAFHPVHRAQLLSYLKLSERRLGFLFNFHVASMKDGIVRMVNNF